MPPPATVLRPDQAEAEAPVTQASAATPVVGVPLSTAVRIQTLHKEREALRLGRPKLWLPVVMTLAGIAATAWAATTYASDSTCLDDYGRRQTCGSWNGDMKRDAAIMGVGAAVVAAGLVFLTVRVIQRRKNTQAAKRADDELRVLNSQARIAPWLSGQGGLAFGMAGSLKF